MLGSVAGYAKSHYYLGTPEFRDEKPKRKRIKKITPKPKTPIQIIKPL